MTAFTVPPPPQPLERGAVESGTRGALRWRPRRPAGAPRLQPTGVNPSNSQAKYSERRNYQDSQRPGAISRPIYTVETLPPRPTPATTAHYKVAKNRPNQDSMVIKVLSTSHAQPSLGISV